MLDSDGSHHGLRAVAAGHTETVGTTFHGVPGQRLQVPPALQHHRLDPQLGRQLDQPEPLDRPVAGPRIAQQDGPTWRALRATAWISAVEVALQRRASAGHRDSEQHENDGEPYGDPIRGTDCPNDGDGEHDQSDDNTDCTDHPAQRALRDDPPAPGHGEHQPDEADEELSEVPEQRPDNESHECPRADQCGERGQPSACWNADASSRHVAGSRMSASALSTLGIEVVAVERLEQPVALHEILQPAAQLDECHVHAFGVQLLVELFEHAGRGHVDVGDRLALHDDPAMADRSRTR